MAVLPAIMKTSSPVNTIVAVLFSCNSLRVLEELFYSIAISLTCNYLVYFTDIWLLLRPFYTYVLLKHIIAKLRYSKINTLLFTLILSLSLTSLLCKTTFLLKVSGRMFYWITLLWFRLLLNIHSYICNV